MPVIASNGEEALAEAEEWKFDLILMDCQMPEMDGLEASRRIRKGRYPGVTIVAVTANAMQEDRDLCMAAGMDDYIGKPIREKELRAILVKYLGGDASAPTLDGAALDEFRSATGKKFDELLAKLLANADALLGDIGRQLQRGDGKGIAETAHRLKSGTGQIGALRLSRLAVEVEQLALKGEHTRIRPLLQAAQDEFAKVNEELKKRARG